MFEQIRVPYVTIVLCTLPGNVILVMSESGGRLVVRGAVAAG